MGSHLSLIGHLINQLVCQAAEENAEKGQYGMGSKKRPVPPPPVIFPLVDAHTHLDSCGAIEPSDVQKMVHRAQEVGVARIVTVSCDVRTLDHAIVAAESHPHVYAAVAQHPTDAHHCTPHDRERLEQYARHPKVVAIGETGLDYYWLRESPDRTAPREVQQELFAWHTELAKRLNKPLMIHNREADEDLLDLLDQWGAPERTIIHCFSSTVEMAQECGRRGYYASFGGATTFGANAELRDAFRAYPDHLILLETDAPYLTPVPRRGQRNEPRNIAYTAARLAEERSMTPEDFARLTTQNACQVYGFSFPRAENMRG